MAAGVPEVAHVVTAQSATSCGRASARTAPESLEIAYLPYKHGASLEQALRAAAEPRRR